jgi:hypothetical protein
MGTFMLVCALVPAEASGAAVVSANKPLTTSQFVKAANRICKQTNTQRDALLAGYIAKLGGKLPDTATLAAAVSEYQPIFQQEIDSLSALKPPKALQRNYTRMLGAARTALATVVANPSGLLALATGGKSPFDGLSRRARALGLRNCAV